MGDEIDPTLTAEEDGSKFDAGGSSEGPSSLNLPLAPPSPLTGCYLLIVIGEPYSQEHKDIIIQKLLKGELFGYYIIYMRKLLITFPIPEIILD